MSGKELKEFKMANYAVSNIVKKEEYIPFDEERYANLVRSAQDRQYYSKNQTCSFDAGSVYRGQQST